MRKWLKENEVTILAAMLALVVSLLLAGVAFGQDEKPNKGLGYVPLTPEKRAYFRALSHAKHGSRIAMMAKNQVLPAAFDVRIKIPLPIWDQRNCGSCYLISEVRTLTSAFVGAGYGKPDDSFKMACQYGMDRPRNFGGCDGGNGTEVIDWAIHNGWIAERYTDTGGVVHNDYPPYEARSGNDRTKAGAKVWAKGADWGFVNANGNPSVEEIKTALVNYGRLNIALDAGGQFGSGTGTITSLGSSINHEINCVGYDDAKQAFLLENQWGDEWGTNGCRWVTYTAAKKIVDWHYIVISPLPPPPPDPVPPTPPVPPGPIGNDRWVLSLIQGSKTTEFTGPLGNTMPEGMIGIPKAELLRIRELIDGALPRMDPPSPMIVPPAKEEEPPTKKGGLSKEGTKAILAALNAQGDSIDKVGSSLGTLKAEVNELSKSYAALGKRVDDVSAADRKEIVTTPASPTASRPFNAAKITVRLPENAVLTANGELVKSLARERTLYTPSLNRGSTYWYILEANLGGVVRRKSLIVSPGQDVEVDFSSQLVSK